MSHLREVGIHTAVPASELFNTVSGIKLANIVALTSRANESACAATEASLRKAGPLVAVEIVKQIVVLHMLKTYLCKRKLFHNCVNSAFCIVNSFFVCRFKNRGNLFEQCIAFVCCALQIKFVADFPSLDIALGVCRIYAETLAKTGFLGSAAGKRNNRAVVASVFIIGINRVCKIHLVKNRERTDIARSYAEDNEILALFSCICNLDFFVFHFYIVKIFCLWEEKIFSRAVSVKFLSKLNAVPIFGKNRNIVLIGRNIKFFNR